MHYHVETGLSGYGPDASDSDGFHCFEDIESAANGAREELGRSTDGINDEASMYAENGDYKEAYESLRLIDAIEILRANIDPMRGCAPLYADNTELWHETLTKLMAETFPYDLDVTGRVRLYVWDCTNTECEENDNV